MADFDKIFGFRLVLTIYLSIVAFANIISDVASFDDSGGLQRIRRSARAYDSAFAQAGGIGYSPYGLSASYRWPPPGKPCGPFCPPWRKLGWQPSAYRALKTRKWPPKGGAGCGPLCQAWSRPLYSVKPVPGQDYIDEEDY